MGRFLRDTWLATAVFVGLSLVVMSLSEFSIRYWHAGTALLLAPTLWRWFVVRQGRPNLGHAALAGATIGFLAVLLPLIAGWAWFDFRLLTSGRASSAGLAGFLDLLLVLLVLGAVPVVGGLGAGIGW